MGIGNLLVSRDVNGPHKALEKHQDAHRRRCADKKPQPFAVSVEEKGNTDFFLDPQADTDTFSQRACLLVFSGREITPASAAVFLKSLDIEAAGPAEG